MNAERKGFRIARVADLPKRGCPIQAGSMSSDVPPVHCSSSRFARNLSSIRASSDGPNFAKNLAVAEKVSESMDSSGLERTKNLPKSPEPNWLATFGYRCPRPIETTIGRAFAAQFYTFLALSKESKMSIIEKSIEVNVPARTAYNQWTQFEEFPRFMNGVLEVRQLDDKMTRWRTNIGGIEKEFDAEITEQNRLAQPIGSVQCWRGDVSFIE
jgi:hypothetical protein